jgi:glutamate N-acetyltransferase/amino-acid N-acetyltransferase
MKIILGGVASAKKFRANGLWCGIKKSGKPDLALIASDIPAVAAGVFTKNSVKAAPLTVSLKNIRDHKIQAIVINSGNANCFTGRFGYTYARQTTRLIGQLLNIPDTDVLVSSTGIIGKPLPYKKIEAAAPRLVRGLSANGSVKAAKAILTTDLKTKEICVTLTINGKTVTIGACAKGSGMVAPNMATMLAFITTDANISAKMLKHAIKAASELSFNRITIDGCMSTNDMAVVLANGATGNKKISAAGKEFDKFQSALNHVCLDLAKRMVKDAEGATKFIAITVRGAKSDKQAKQTGLAIANSALVKTAAFGKNPNWGRVAAAVGSLEIKSVTEDTLKINFSDFSKEDITIEVSLGIGKGSATVYTSDLSYEYVRINGAYN